MITRLVSYEPVDPDNPDAEFFGTDCRECEFLASGSACNDCKWGLFFPREEP